MQRGGEDDPLGIRMPCSKLCPVIKTPVSCFCSSLWFFRCISKLFEAVHMAIPIILIATVRRKKGVH